MNYKRTVGSAVAAAFVAAAFPGASRGQMSAGSAAPAGAAAAGSGVAGAAASAAAPSVQGTPLSALPAPTSAMPVPLRAAILEYLRQPEFRDPAKAAAVLAQSQPAGYAPEALAVLRRAVAYPPGSEYWQAAFPALGAEAARKVLWLRAGIMAKAGVDEAAALDWEGLRSHASRRMDREASERAMRQALGQAQALLSGLAIETLMDSEGSAAGQSRGEAVGGLVAPFAGRGKAPIVRLAPSQPPVPGADAARAESEPLAPALPRGSVPDEGRAPGLFTFRVLSHLGIWLTAGLGVLVQNGAGAVLLMTALVGAFGAWGLQAAARHFGWSDPRTSAAALWAVLAGLGVSILLALQPGGTLLSPLWGKILAVAGPFAAGLIQLILPTSYGEVPHRKLGRFIASGLPFFMAAIGLGVGLMSGPALMIPHIFGLLLMVFSIFQGGKPMLGLGLFTYLMSILAALAA